jgi:signal transduction histidine kinase
LRGAYLASLRSHCAQAAPANPQIAVEIGRKAVVIGLETLDLARIHAVALADLLVPTDTPAMRADVAARAAEFFTEAITPIEETHGAALKAAAKLAQLHAALDQLMLELAEANAKLQRQIAERSAAETSLQHSQRSSSRLLEDSRALEQRLQEMTHHILSATEDERRKLSLRLSDGVAQILLGIHLRILALHREAAAKHTNLSREIAATRRLVATSAKTISRLVNEFRPPKEH